MKKILLGALLIATGFASAQTDMNRWSISYGFGSHLWTKPSSTPSANLWNLHIAHHELNGRYMFNNRFGLMVDLSFDQFSYAGMTDQKTHYISPTIQGVVNVGDILKIGRKNRRLGLLAHAGGGYSVMWQTVPKRTSNDNMINFSMGLTPQLRLTDHWSLKADATFHANAFQNRTYDWQRKTKQVTQGKDIHNVGYFFNLSVGVTYHIGKNERHADWTPTLTADMPLPRDYDQELEELSNKLDNLDNRVNDIDDQINGHDGRITTLEDAEPAETGGRGTALSSDLEKILLSTTAYFDLNSSFLKQESYSDLNRLVEYLKLNTSYSLDIKGYADATGSSDINMPLSRNRANAVKNYLVNKGVDASRITTEGKGSASPAASNSDRQGRSQNRRVEISIVD